MVSKPLPPKIILTPGEPAGIGPDCLIMLAQQGFPAQLVTCADPDMLQKRAEQLQLPLTLETYSSEQPASTHAAGKLYLLDVNLAETAIPGHASTANADYVLQTIDTAVEACLREEFAALVTGPVNKSIIAKADPTFFGHTEHIAKLCDCMPVMLLANDFCRVALVTTHLPLQQVPSAITRDRLEETIHIVQTDLIHKFAIAAPTILVCGLNPHAGEEGHLGHEETDIIEPVVKKLRKQGYDLRGPLPADTAFTQAVLQDADAVICMYHDQGLPVIKSHGFGETVNITLGLPILRTSVDHGTAFELAGTGQANPQSFITAINMAIELAAMNKK